MSNYSNYIVMDLEFNFPNTRFRSERNGVVLHQEIIALEDNMEYHGMPIDGLPRCFDIQLMFDDQVTMEGRDFALNYAMWKMEIKPALSHDALNDAINTAEVMRHLDLSEGLEGYEI